MAKNKYNFFHQIGIKNKDLNDISGCFTFLIILPIYIIYFLIKETIKLISFFISIISPKKNNCNDNANEKKEINDNKINDLPCYNEKKQFEVFKEYDGKSLKKIILENNCITSEFYFIDNKVIQISYTLKFENGSFFAGGINNIKDVINESFDENEYTKYFYIIFEIARGKYYEKYKKTYKYNNINKNTN